MTARIWEQAAMTVSRLFERLASLKGDTIMTAADDVRKVLTATAEVLDLLDTVLPVIKNAPSDGVTAQQLADLHGKVAPLQEQVGSLLGGQEPAVPVAAPVAAPPEEPPAPAAEPDGLAGDGQSAAQQG